MSELHKTLTNILEDHKHRIETAKNSSHPTEEEIEKYAVENQVTLNLEQKAFAKFLEKRFSIPPEKKSVFMRRYKRCIFYSWLNFSSYKKGNNFQEIAETLEELNNDIFMQGRHIQSDLLLFHDIQTACIDFLKNKSNPKAERTNYNVKMVAGEIYTFWKDDLERDTTHYNRYYDGKRHPNSEFKDFVDLIQKSLEQAYGHKQGLDHAIDLLNKEKS